MTTIKIKPSHPSQGEYVLLDKSDFNPEVHELYDDGTDQGIDAGQRPPTLAELQAAHERLLDVEARLTSDRAHLDERESDLRQREQAHEAAVKLLADDRAAFDKQVAERAAADKAADATKPGKKAADKPADDSK